jgi:hypothetical protein
MSEKDHPTRRTQRRAGRAVQSKSCKVVKYPTDEMFIIVLDGIIVKSSKATDALYNYNLTGKPILEIVDASERVLMRERIKQYFITMRGNKKPHLYLDMTRQFYFGVRSKVVLWQGKKAIFSIAEKIDMPVQLPLKFFG